MVTLICDRCTRPFEPSAELRRRLHARTVHGLRRRRVLCDVCRHTLDLSACERKAEEIRAKLARAIERLDLARRQAQERQHSLREQSRELADRIAP